MCDAGCLSIIQTEEVYMSVKFRTAVSVLHHESILRGLYPTSSKNSDLEFILLNLSYK